KVRAIGGAGIRSVSLAPETGDETLRLKLGKVTGDDDYVNAAGLLAGEGIERMSLYLMTGLPGEDSQVFDATVSFLERIAAAGRGMRISVHVNVMVPKPWTPMQFFAVPAEKDLRERIRILSGAAERAGMDVQAKPLRNSVRQAQLSLGGRAAGDALIEYAGGSISWKKAFAPSERETGSIHVERGIDMEPPWYGIDGPAGHELLLARYRKVTG
ncbi:MAG TPA: hypothetical protein VLA34_08430, partial [Candidatus Krumholzibacterium sp.]|nr:hypothetical protein [Candidatus Krumholzibacterium sp.]